MQYSRGNLPSAKKWNSTGRAYPDVSALSANYVVVQDFIPMPGVAGTSCAAPVFSGVIALLNDVRLRAGKSPLGYLNPLLYHIAKTNPTGFTDITKGSNPGCGTDGFCKCCLCASKLFISLIYHLSCHQGLGSFFWSRFSCLL
jgi:subtilase family serine protease